MAVVFSLVAEKGGSGRTMLNQNIAGVLAEEECSVLVVDLDPQGSITENFFGPDFAESLHPSETSAALFDELREPDEELLVKQTPVANISIVAGSSALSKFDLPNPSSLGEQQHSVGNFLHGLKSRFDFIIVDTPPNIRNLFVWSAVLASDFIVTPVQPEVNSCTSIGKVMRLMGNVYQQGVSPMHLGFAISVHDQRLSLEKIRVAEIQLQHGRQVFQTLIPRRTTYNEAKEEYLPITHFRPKSEEAELVRALVVEVFERYQVLASQVDSHLVSAAGG